MNTIYKYPIRSDQNMYEFPVGATFLHVAFQGDTLCLWALVDSNVSTLETRCISVFGTGHEIPDEATRYLGTAHQPPYVWHVWEAT